MSTRSILIVEDEVIIAMELEMLLQDLGYNVCEVVGEGRSILPTVKEKQPDLILMDITLKDDISGVDAAKILYDQNYDTPIVYCSALINRERLKRIKLPNTYGFIIKPIREDSLYTTIELCFEKYRLEQDLKLKNEVLEQTNEELEETNEELEETNEELEETNEELEQTNEELEQTNEELKVSEHKLSIIFNNNTDPQLLWEIDSNDKIRLVSVNRAYMDVISSYGINLNKSDFIGKTIEDVAKLSGISPEVLDYTLEQYHKAIRTKKVVKYNVNVELKGNPYYSEYTLTPILDDDCKCIYVLFNSYNITDIVNAQKELKNSEEKFRKLFEYANDAIFIAEAETGILIDANKSAEELIGKTKDEIIGMRHIDLHPPDQEALAKVLFKEDGNQKGECIYKEFRVLHKDGSIIPVEISPTNINIDGKEVIYGIFRDITERKRLEESLKDKTELLDQTGEMAKVGGWEFDPDTNKQIWTSETYRIHEVDSDFIPTVEKGINFFHPDHRFIIGKAVQNLIDNDTPYDLELKLITAKGREKWVHIKGFNVRKNGKLIKVKGSIQDITDRKEMEENLHDIKWMLEKKKNLKSRRKKVYEDPTNINTERLILDSVGKDLLTNIINDYLDLLETSSAVYERNGDYAQGIFSSNWCNFLDKASYKLCGTGNLDEALRCEMWFCHRSCWDNNAKKIIESGKPLDIECAGGIHIYGEPIMLDGEVIGVINFGYGNPPVDDEEKLKEIALKYEVSLGELKREARMYRPRPQYIIDLAKERLRHSALLISEIVGRKEKEKELIELNRKVEILINAIPDMIFELDNEGVILYYKAPKAELYDQSVETLVGKRNDEVLPKELYVQLNNLIKKTLSTNTIQTFEYQLDIPDCGINSYEARMVVSGHHKVMAIVRNITERKKMEKELEIFNKRLEESNKELETFAYRVAHDLKSPLSSIISGLRLLSKDKELTNDRKAYFIERMNDKVYQLVDQIESILKFSKIKISKNFEHINFKHLIDHVIEDLNNIIKNKSAEIITDNIDVNVYVDKSLFVSVINNLLYNALKYNESHPEIIISSLKRDKDQLFYIKDNGIGISERDQKQIFELMYRGENIKDDYDGTGIGLSSCKKIVELHGGSIWVESELNRGSVFYFTIPRE